ncbi:site-specific integrase [Rhizobium sp. NFR12]|uniref:site-specific integrase n=1 Tax=Rhizobium sp. NFR12 TaxID=1566261 RepID=UPI001587F5F3|nr:site-specific integrase [Rhizobium sp. NFR12]
MASPFLNGSIYWLRKKIPEDLRPVLKKREEKFSLKTRDPAEAKIRFARALAEIEERWGRLRQGVKSLSHKESLAMAGEIYRRMIAEEEENPCGLLLPMLFEGYFHGRSKVFIAGTDPEASQRMFQEMVDRRNTEITKRIESFLVDGGYQIDDVSRSTLQKHTEDAVLKARRKIYQMAKGDYSPDPAAASFPPYVPPQKILTASSTSRAPTLSTAIAGWVKEKTRNEGDWRKTTAAANELWAQRFMELVGDKPLRAYTKTDARTFKQAVMSLPPMYGNKKGFEGLSFSKAVERAKTAEVEPMSDRNVNKILGFVRAFWNWAEAQYDEVPGNPFNGMNLRVKSKARDERLPFSMPQLQKILNAPLFTGCKSEKSWLTPGGHVPVDQGIYWVPLIGLFTGARAGEIIQLRVDDIKDEGGILHLNITDDGEEQEVKTDTSIRTIPVHPILKKLGFEKFVAAQRKRGTRLFPDFPKAADGYYSTAYSPRYKRFLESIDVKMPKITFHSFRHSFEDACLNSRIPVEFTNALQGHAGSGMAARYGTGIVRLRLLNEEMEKLHYEGLDFDRLMQANISIYSDSHQVW